MNPYEDIEKALLESLMYSAEDWDLSYTQGRGILAMNRNIGVRLEQKDESVFWTGPICFGKEFSDRFKTAANTFLKDREMAELQANINKTAKRLRHVLSIPDSTSRSEDTSSASQ